MKRDRARVFGHLALAGLAALALSSCGGGSRPAPEPSAPGPSAPPGTTQVTGSERVAWDQGGNIGSLRFRGYLDGNPVALDQATCDAAAATCSSPLPSMTDGLHTLAIAAVSPNGEESSRSPALNLQKVAAQSVVSATFVAQAASDGTPVRTSGTLSAPGGRIFSLEVVSSSLKSPVQMDARPDGRLLVAEADGRVRMVDAAGGDRLISSLEPHELLRPEPIGPLGLALHPDFARNRFAYVSFLAHEGPKRLIVRIVRMRDAGDRLGEPATLFEAPLAAAPELSLGAPRMAFGPDGRLYLLLPPGVEFDDERVAARPQTSMTVLDEDGRVAVSNGLSIGTSHPLGFGWDPLTALIWGIVPQAEGRAALLPLAEGGMAGVLAWRNAPLLGLDASRSDGALVVRQDASADWPRWMAEAFNPAAIRSIRLTRPVRVDGLIDGIAGQIVDVVSAGEALYVAVEGFDPPQASTADPAAVILRITEQPR